MIHFSYLQAKNVFVSAFPHQSFTFTLDSSRTEQDILICSVSTSPTFLLPSFWERGVVAKAPESFILARVPLTIHLFLLCHLRQHPPLFMTLIYFVFLVTVNTEQTVECAIIWVMGTKRKQRIILPRIVKKIIYKKCYLSRVLQNGWDFKRQVWWRWHCR